MTTLITVLGIVQGVGYRPFVARLARELKITGTVLNSGGIVKIVANGEKEVIDIFVHRLKFNSPKGANVTEIKYKSIPEQSFNNFKIVTSVQSADEVPIIPADLPMCEDCRRELYDLGNRRYRYPFISCIACGPRYSIINSLPYDRETITMDSFQMCDNCADEYTEEDNRRRHAQTISCRDCGPQLILQLPRAEYHKDEALRKAIELLNQGLVLAIKGIGGYQFACLPNNPQAIENLRLLKHRDKKPFAVMFSNLQMLKMYCKVSAPEEQLLTSAACPICLLQKNENTFCDGVSGESRFIGAFLPYTPLHQLLTDACGSLVMTSGNLTNEPININDEDMLSLSSPHLAGVLYNLRQIVTPLDDSVARIVCNKTQLVRRSRGYVPLPVNLQQEAKRDILAMGGDLKSCFCLYKNSRAYVSQYFGDMENYHVSKVYEENLSRMENLFVIHPEIIACDMHPQYVTSGFAEKLSKINKIKLLKIQHHHAHAASVMAENNLSSCIGVVFDGTGYGTDGAVWGGEVLLCNGTKFERSAHLGYVKLCGGDSAAKNAEFTAYSYLNAVGKAVDNNDFKTLQAAIKNNINTFNSSSMGRLFDAVSAVLSIKTYNTYEGECAIALENCAADFETNGKEPYPLHFEINYDSDIAVVNQIDIIKDIFEASQNGVSKGALALGFHKAIAKMVCEVCIHIRENSGENRVTLSGGVFANLLLTQFSVKLLENAEFEVYINSEVPTNDGGISLGQAWLCGQMQN